MRTRHVRTRRSLALAAAALMLAPVPAAAQTGEPYPPGQPGDPGASVVCEFRSDQDRPSAVCTGQGLAPGTELTVEVTIDGTGGSATSLGLATATALQLLAQGSDGDEVVADDEDTVSADGTAQAAVTFSCADLDGDSLTVTGVGQDPDGDEVSDSETRALDEVCLAGAGSARPTGGLAFTGSDIGLLVAIGLLLTLAGYGLSRSRRRRPA